MAAPSRLPDELRIPLEQFLEGNPPENFRLDKRVLKVIVNSLHVDLNTMTGTQRTRVYDQVKTWIRTFAESQRTKTIKLLQRHIFINVQMLVSQVRQEMHAAVPPPGVRLNGNIGAIPPHQIVQPVPPPPQIPPPEEPNYPSPPASSEDVDLDIEPVPVPMEIDPLDQPAGVDPAPLIVNEPVGDATHDLSIQPSIQPAVIIIDSDDEEDPAVTAERMAREAELRRLAAVDKKPTLPMPDVSMEIGSPMAELQVSEPENEPTVPPVVTPRPESRKVASKSTGKKRGRKPRADTPAAETSTSKNVASESTAAPEGKIYELDMRRFFDPFSTSSIHFNLKPQQLTNYAYELSRRDKKLYANPQIAPPLSDMSDIEYKHLFFWPNVAIILSLPHIEIVRKILPNDSLELIVPGTPLHTLDLAKNDMGVKCYADTPAEGDLCAAMIKHYLKNVLRCLERSKNNQRHEIIVFIERFLAEFAPFERCSRGVEYTRFISPYRYHRVLGAAEESSDEQSPDLEQLFLRQITAPEVVFKITRCAFTEPPGNGVEAVLKGMHKQFTAVITERKEEAQAEFDRTLARAISIRCVECDKNFYGNLLVLHMRHHIKNFINDEWQCVMCTAKFKPKTMVEQKWSHGCSG